MTHNESSANCEGLEQTHDQNQGQQTLNLLGNLQNPESLKQLKNLIGGFSTDDIVNLLKGVQEVYQDLANNNAFLRDENQRLQSENDTLKAKILNINEGRESSMRNTTPQVAPGPITVDGQDEYELNNITACRLFQGKLQYKAGWVGYPPDDTWYPARDFKNSPYAIQTYHENNPDGPRPPKRLGEWRRCFEKEETDQEHSDDDDPAEA